MILLQNKKARFDYDISEEHEAGISLLGWEVKSLRSKRGNMASAWVAIRDEEAFLEGLKLVRWEFAQQEQDLTRSRKLLLHKKEIRRLEHKIKEVGYTFVPLQIFVKNGKLKVLLGLGKGRKRHEKKKYIQEREVKREGLKDLN
ncbi:MAG TPA: SsrA-binding protein SmpB [Candidatus Gracilibacteria bacterium]